LYLLVLWELHTAFLFAVAQFPKRIGKRWTHAYGKIRRAVALLLGIITVCAWFVILGGGIDGYLLTSRNCAVNNLNGRNEYQIMNSLPVMVLCVVLVCQ